MKQIHVVLKITVTRFSLHSYAEFEIDIFWGDIEKEIVGKPEM